MSATPMTARETRTVTIAAATFDNHTGVLLQPGITYQLRAHGTWCDASIKCGPDGHDAAKLRSFRWMRRAPRQNWFALIGHAAGQTFPISTAATITPAKAGELLCYANDVPFMYWNNKGAVTLTIVRT
jgi:hypothetical protein